MTWPQLERDTQNQVRWRVVVAALCSTGATRIKEKLFFSSIFFLIQQPVCYASSMCIEQTESVRVAFYDNVCQNVNTGFSKDAGDVASAFLGALHVPCLFPVCRRESNLQRERIKYLNRFIWKASTSGRQDWSTNLLLTKQLVCENGLWLRKLNEFAFLFCCIYSIYITKSEVKMCSF